MLSGLVAFFGFADLGVGNGLLNRILIANAANDRLERRRITLAAYASTVAVAFLIVVAWSFWALLAPVPTVLVGRVVVEHRSEVLLALDVFVLLLATNIPASLIQKIQLGMQRGYWVGLTQFAAAVGTLVAVPAALAFDGRLPALVAASLGVQVAANVTSTLLWQWRLSLRERTDKSIAFAFPEWSVVWSLLRTGSLFFVLQLAAAFAFQSDSIVIVHQLGQQAYGDFAVVQRVFLTASSLLLAGLAGFWPAVGEALFRGDREWVRNSLYRGLSIAFFVTGGICGLLVAMMPSITAWWLHMVISPAATLLWALAAWTTIEAMGNVSASVLNAAGLLRSQVLIAAVMAAFSFTGKWYLVPLLGPQGAVIATLCSYLAISVPVQIWLLRSYSGEAGVAGKLVSHGGVQ